MSLHDYRCSGDCGPCGGIGGIEANRCLTCGGTGKCVGCAPPEGVVYPERIATALEGIMRAASAWRYDVGPAWEITNALDEFQQAAS